MNNIIGLILVYVLVSVSGVDYLNIRNKRERERERVEGGLYLLDEC